MRPPQVCTYSKKDQEIEKLHWEQTIEKEGKKNYERAVRRPGEYISEVSKYS